MGNKCICDWDERKHCGCFRPGVCDVPAAQSELAALREELFKRAGDIGRISGERDALREELASANECALKYSEQAVDLQQRLTAAEQRNAELVELLRHVFYSVGYWNTDTCDRVEAALKPTESGASGSTCNQIREESGLPINNPCIACKNGACIDK